MILKLENLFYMEIILHLKDYEAHGYYCDAIVTPTMMLSARACDRRLHSNQRSSSTDDTCDHCIFYDEENYNLAPNIEELIKFWKALNDDKTT